MTVLTLADRDQLAARLVQVIALAATIEEHLTVAAYRAGTLPSAWSEARLDAIRDAATELAAAVRSSPLEVD